MATIAVLHGKSVFRGVAVVLHFRGKRVFRGVAVVLRVIGCILYRKMAAEITPLGAACQATWSTVIILGSPAFLEILAKHVC